MRLSPLFFHTHVHLMLIATMLVALHMALLVFASAFMYRARGFLGELVPWPISPIDTILTHHLSLVQHTSTYWFRAAM
jgi:hypothetical protein